MMDSGTDEGETLVQDILQAVAPEHKLSDWDVTLETTIGFDNGTVIYTVKVGNDSDQMIRKILVKPAVTPEMFGIEVPQRVVGPLRPGESQTVVFRLKPHAKEWDMGIESKLLSGRDVAIKALLVTRGGNVSYQLTVENKHKWSLRFLKVRPVLPEDFVPVDEEKMIDLLAPGEMRTVTFDLIAKTKWDLLQKHEAALATPWMFDTPRVERRMKGLPRTYSDEEMALLKKHLLFMEADEELLRFIGTKGVEEEALEIDIICDFMPHITEDAQEEEFAVREIVIGQVIEEWPFEEPMDFKRRIVLEVSEEDAIEEDFDIEIVREVRPLELEETVLEDIELEPMEMDL